MAEVKIKSNVDEVLTELRRNLDRGMWAIGASSEGHAKDYTPVDTGRLRNSISHLETENEIYIGTNVEYAPYIEVGTGIYTDGGLGRKTAWMVKPDGAGKYKEPFWTHGVKPSHMLKKAVMNHKKEYAELLQAALKG